MDTQQGAALVRGRGWRIPPRILDASIVVVFGVVAVLSAIFGPLQEGATDGGRPVAVVFAVCVTVPLYWRRSKPGLALAICWALVLPFLILDMPGTTVPGAVYLATYSVGAHGDRRTSLAGGAASVLLMAAISLAGVLHGEPNLRWGDVATNTVVMGIIWLIGDNMRARRLYTASLEERAHRLEHEAELEAARAAAEERARLARELHDVVAHSVSTIVVQAGGARRVLEAEPEQAAHALQVIETTGRDALTELRRVLGVLRANRNGAEPLKPQPGLARLDNLVDAVREAGLPVEVEVKGTPFPLPAAVDLSAYRIVQEALTNVLKHAGEARARVELVYAAGWLGISVSDDGRGAAAQLRGSGGGHGLAGMRERVGLLGGALLARPKPGGGWEVHARLPIGDPS